MRVLYFHQHFTTPDGAGGTRSYEFARALVARGHSVLMVSELIASRGGRFTRLVHRTVVLGHEVDLAEGVILCPYVVVSANNRLGRGVAVNLHASIDHDANVGDWSQVNCHCDLTAAVEVGHEVFMGSRVSVIPNVRIGDGAYIGAGSVVLRDVPPGWKVVGCPARRIG